MQKAEHFRWILKDWRHFESEQIWRTNAMLEKLHDVFKTFEVFIYCITIIYQNRLILC